MLVLQGSFCLGLVAFRILYTGEWMFAFLVWNLFLAYLPYGVSQYIAQKGERMSLIPILLFLIGWLLLIPNAFYIITDLFHLEHRDPIPLWYDLALLMAYAWNGLIVGVLSVRQIEQFLLKKWKHANEWFFVIPVMALNALGIYIGRYLRFNSWDVITNPLQLIHEVSYLLMHPFRNRFDWSMIICFTVLLSFVYLTLKNMAEHSRN
jgi:uncharacterized membrane protein